METLKKIFGIIVPTFFSTTSGVSISGIARVQAESKQQNDPFWGKLSEAVNGIFRKEILFIGPGGGTPQSLEAPLITPAEIKEYEGVADRGAVIASLMHGLKLWKRLQGELERMDLRRFVVDSFPEAPEHPVREELVLPPAPERPTPAKSGSLCGTKEFMELSNIDEMIAQLAPEVLARFDLVFWVRANGLNSRAAVLGKLMSEQGAFFRELVKPRPKDEERPLQNGVVLTRWKLSYSEEQVGELKQLREELQATYNDLQQQLNGCRKQIKDAVRAYNLEQEHLYQAVFGAYQVEFAKHSGLVAHLRVEVETKFQAALEAYRDAYDAYVVDNERIRLAAETMRQEAQAELAALRIRTE